MKVGIITSLLLFSIITKGNGLKCYQCHDKGIGDDFCKDKKQGELEECMEGAEFCYLRTDNKEQGILNRWDTQNWHKKNYFTYYNILVDVRHNSAAQL